MWLRRQYLLENPRMQRTTASCKTTTVEEAMTSYPLTTASGLRAYGKDASPKVGGGSMVYDVAGHMQGTWVYPVCSH